MHDDSIDLKHSSTPIIPVLLALSLGIVIAAERAVTKAYDVRMVARRASWWITFGAVPLLIAAMSKTGIMNEQLGEDLAYRLRDAALIWWRWPFFIQWVATLVWIAVAIAFGAYVRVPSRSTTR